VILEERRLDVLIRRRDHLQQRLDEKKFSENSVQYLKAELSALKWAVKELKLLVNIRKFVAILPDDEEITWNDPDEDATTRTFKVGSWKWIDRDEGLLFITDKEHTFELECYVQELSYPTKRTSQHQETQGAANVSSD
jgi:hypothetical protein